ncbi:hypothetical protein [Streptomyces sp. NRRL S-646]|uniref:hypothetical protein n=1 Tax=Streptomyces sp. NRRL S-646 TaxID=1463917 RepID=UPI000A651F5F|nr:hypothetical protein [Streptomyces sp. NRRL S-646]
MAPPRYELTLRGPISRTVLDVIRTRFDQVSTPGAYGTVLIVENVDQASVRALLTLLWDTGHDVLTFEETTTPESPNNGCATGS